MCEGTGNGLSSKNFRLLGANLVGSLRSMGRHSASNLDRNCAYVVASLLPVA